MCRFCGKTLADVPLGFEMTNRGETRQHCDAPGCDWCVPCEIKRLQGFAAAAGEQ